MSIVEKLNEEIKNCMKTKQEERLSVVRMLKSKILLVNARGDISDEEAVAIIRKYSKNLKETIAITKEQGRDEAAKEAESELAIVQEFLPPEMTEDQLKIIIQKAVSELGEGLTKADMGKVMKAVMPLCKGADGNAVKNIVSSLLK